MIGGESGDFGVAGELFEGTEREREGREVEFEDGKGGLAGGNEGGVGGGEDGERRRVVGVG